MSPEQIGRRGLSLALATLALVPCGLAATIPVNSPIVVSETWTADNVYDLQAPVRVMNGATLTIEAGTLVTVTPGSGGALAVARGARLHVLGTQSAPVIMTSTLDVATWTGGDPTTGTWQAQTGLWGHLALLGNAYIADDAPGNSPVPSPSNETAMIGLVPMGAGDTTHLYGGGDDEDDSGSIAFLSLRYGGLIPSVGFDLPTLALGGVGRGTDIHHVDVMNGLDDGIAVFGGAVDLKYVNIWNVGDDSFDVDEGWRGRLQFGLLVQGYCRDAVQGTGVGDNAFEVDGADACDWQPVTTATIANVTVIGQPVDGDGGTAWRDNARVQYHDCIFMDLGDQLVRRDELGPPCGYGWNGTLSWADTWTTPFSTSSPVNPFPGDASPYYQAQTSGNLAAIQDSVFFRNLAANAYTEATARGVFVPAHGNVLTPGFDDADAPVSVLTRGAPVIVGGKTMLPVTLLDPRPANDALTDALPGPAALDPFFTTTDYRGAFAPGETWLDGWTASAAFGFTPQSSPWRDEGCALEGLAGPPELTGLGTQVAGADTVLDLVAAAPDATAGLFFSLSSSPTPFKGGILKAFPLAVGPVITTTDPLGRFRASFPWPSGAPSGSPSWWQWAVVDAGAPFGVALSNAVKGTTP